MNLKRIQDMATIPARLTGLAGIVYISAAIPRHKPRIKFRFNNIDVSFYIETGEISAPKQGLKISSKIISEVKDWIYLNKDKLIKHWNNPDEYTSADFIFEVERVLKHNDD